MEVYLKRHEQGSVQPQILQNKLYACKKKAEF